MPVNILNLSGLDVVDFRETDTEYHVRAAPKAISRLCPHCGRSNDTVVHAKRTLVIRDIPSHGKAVVSHIQASETLVSRILGSPKKMRRHQAPVRENDVPAEG